MVPACPKYISGKLRSFSKNFSKNFFHTALFENFLPNSLSVADAKNEPAQGLGTPKIRRGYWRGYRRGSVVFELSVPF